MTDGAMARVTLRMPPRQVRQLDRMVEQGHYPNRSEAIRAGVRELLDTQRRVSDLATDGGIQRRDTEYGHRWIEPAIPTYHLVCRICATESRVGNHDGVFHDRSAAEEAREDHLEENPHHEMVLERIDR